MEFLAGLGVDAGRLEALGGPAGVARLKAEGARADCEVGADLTARLGLPEAVRRAVLDSFERFDGLGVPAGRAGPEVAEASRFATAGFAAVMFDAAGGGEAAARAVARWSGRAGSGDRRGVPRCAGRTAGDRQPGGPVGGRGRCRAGTATRVRR